MALALLLAAAGVLARGAPPAPRLDAADLERRIHAGINAQRRERGLAPLAWNDALARIARRHSADMSARAYFAHASPEGDNFSERYEKAGFRCAVRVGDTIHGGAENIALQRLYYRAVGSSEATLVPEWNSAETIARATVSGWMGSPGHRRNILDPVYGSEGIGIVIGPGNQVLVTQDFC